MGTFLSQVCGGGADNQAEATATIEAERFGPALKKIDEAVQEAQENATEHGRPSAWRYVSEPADDMPNANFARPELSAKAICAAANLPVYDDTYARLRSEYLGVGRYLTYARKD